MFAFSPNRNVFHLQTNRTEYAMGAACSVNCHEDVKPFVVSNIPLPVMTDLYKQTHGDMAPEDIQRTVILGNPRSPLNINDHVVSNKIIVYGGLYYVETYIDRIITKNDVKDTLNHTQGVIGFVPPRFKKDMESLVGKKWPVKLYALPEGTVVLPQTPVFKIVAEGRYAHLGSYLETLLTMVWYPMSVATMTASAMDVMRNTLKTINFGDDDKIEKDIRSRFHDFGFRGCTCPEQSVIGGSAKLLVSPGSDTNSASYYVQKHLNNGIPVGESIPATEHSLTLMSKTEGDAMVQSLIAYGEGLVSIVMDTNDLIKGMNEVFPESFLRYLKHRKAHNAAPNYENLNNNIHEIKLYGETFVAYIDNPKSEFHTLRAMIPSKGVYIFRPDSGNPYLAVVLAFIAALKIFGIDANASHIDHRTGKLHIAIPHAGAIQGDGINIIVMEGICKIITGQEITQEDLNKLSLKGQKEIIEARDEFIRATNNEWAFLLCAFGMGGGLLQKVDRDSISFATKLSEVEYTDGTIVMKMKDPNEQKRSIPGDVKVIMRNGCPQVVPIATPGKDMFELVFDGTKKRTTNKYPEISFDELREKTYVNWKSINTAGGPKGDGRSAEILALQEKLHQQKQAE